MSDAITRLNAALEGRYTLDRFLVEGGRSMKAVTRTLAAALALACATCSAPSSTAIVVTNALIIDGLGGPPIADGVVVADGGRIIGVGPAGSVTIPVGAQIIDADGGAVMPGLADMHVHMLGGWDGEGVDMLGYQRYLNALLYSGVTTVLDIGSVLPFIQQIRAEVDAGRLAGPRIYMVGPLVDGPNPAWPPLTYSAHDANTLRSIVAQLSAAGVDAIKGYVGLSEEMVDSLVRIAADESLPVIVHLGSSVSPPAAVRSGVRAFAHTPRRDWNDDEVAAMIGRGTAVITTLAVTESFSRRRFQDLAFLDHSLIASTTPPWFLDDLRRFASAEMSDRQVAIATANTVRLMESMGTVKQLHDAGVPMVSGTDAPYPGVFQGEGVHRELELLVEAGLSPLEAITAATRNAAALMGAEGEWGAIEPGLVADLVIVRGNPAENIADTRNIIYVIQRGVLLDRDALAFDLQTDLGSRTVGSVAN